MNKLRIPSVIQLNILQYSGYCPKCHTYDNHTIDSCDHCEDFLCEQNGDIVWFVGDTNSIICRKCILKRIDLFGQYYFTVR